jgi:hypothetical protein
MVQSNWISDELAKLDEEIAEARRAYWNAVRRRAEAEGITFFAAVTAQAQTVDPQGNVFIGGKLVGSTEPPRNGWHTWGIEAAGAPFSTPLEPKREKHLLRESMKAKRFRPE